MAFYSEEFIDEVKSANDIVDVISGYVNLKRQGTTFFGNCPFHREKTASFAVTPDKQIFHCFGCGVGGNVISFIMKAENLGFKESVEFLAERAKLDIPQNSDDKEKDEELKIREYHKTQMYEINKEAGRFFFKNIYSSKLAQDYISKRNLDMATITKFGIGFAKEDNGLYKHLKEKGFKETDMLATGLVGKTDRNTFYDKFKNRLMFPIFDIRGRVVAFGGRALGSHEELKEKHIPKYVNSPENLIYTKGKHLYGLNLAKKTSEKLKRILVVEGYMDVVSPVAKGVTNVVASLGTALTENQGKLLRQYADEVVLSYDSDAAGQNAIMRGIDIMQSLGVTCKVLQMKDAKDPDEFVIKFGADRFNALIDNSLTAVEYKIQILKSKFNLNDTSEKIRFLNKMAEVLSKVPNNIERDIYIEKLSKELGVGKEALVAEVEKILFKDKESKPKTFELPKVEDNNLINNESSEEEETILFLLLSKNLDVYKMIKEDVETKDFNSVTNKSLLSKLYQSYENNSYNQVDFTTLCSSEEELSQITKLLIKTNTSNDYMKMTNEVLRLFRLNKLQKRKNELVELMKQTKDQELLNNYQAELRMLIQNSAKK
ncbi:MAG: DNA primase [Clostridia bacterium]|nr:DNA primase [Clostridia bacterium]